MASEIRKMKYPETGMEVETVVINDKPFWKWTIREHQVFQRETLKLQTYLEKVKYKVAYLAQRKGHKF